MKDITRGYTFTDSKTDWISNKDTSIRLNKMIDDATVNIVAGPNITLFRDSNGINISASSGSSGSPGYYGVFYDSTDQLAVSANTPYAIKLNNTVESIGVNISNNSRINIVNGGTYNLQFSIQLENSASHVYDVNIWLRKNGSNVTATNSIVSVDSKHGSVHGHLIPSWNFVFTAAANDYYELMWSTESTDVSIETIPAVISPAIPLTPSAIVTVSQVVNIAAAGSITGTQIAPSTITGTNIANATIIGTNIANATITAVNIGNATITAANIANATITAANIENATITGAKIANATISGGNIANATITSALIENAAITGAKIANATITSSNIENATITGSKIAAATITGTEIANATITGSKIALSTVSGSNIANQTISASKLVDATITATQIENLTISASKIVNLTINGDKIASDAITNPKIADSAVTGSKVADATITGGKLANATITGTQIANATITGSKMVAATITGTEIANATITGTKMVDATITGTQIENATITGTKMANATITGTQIALATITGTNIVDATITGTKIENATITGGKLANATITGTEIANSTITGTKIANATITAGNIQAATITGTEIANLTITGSNIIDATITNIKIQSIDAGKITAGTITATISLESPKIAVAGACYNSASYTSNTFGSTSLTIDDNGANQPSGFDTNTPANLTIAGCKLYGWGHTSGSFENRYGRSNPKISVFAVGEFSGIGSGAYASYAIQYSTDGGTNWYQVTAIDASVHYPGTFVSVSGAIELTGMAALGSVDFRFRLSGSVGGSPTFVYGQIQALCHNF